MAKCPHCTTENDTGATFCFRCGLAMPPDVPSAPRLVWGEGTARTHVGREMQLDLLERQSGKAFGALLAVAAVVGADAILGCCMSGGFHDVSKPTFAAALSVDLVTLVLFLGLAVWARFRPYPAAVAGLVVCISLCLTTAIMSPVTMLLALLVKILAIVLLIQVILANGKYRRLRAVTATTERF